MFYKLSNIHLRIFTRCGSPGSYLSSGSSKYPGKSEIKNALSFIEDKLETFNYNTALQYYIYLKLLK